MVLAQFAAADGVCSIYAMLPTIYREFPSQSGAVSWIVTTFFLVAATVAAIVGRLADVLGRRTVAIALLCIAALGAFLGSVAHSVAPLIAASVLIGVTMVLTPVLIGLAREDLAPEKLSFGIAAISAAGCAGAGLVFLLTGFIVDNFGRAGGYTSMGLLSLLAAGLIAIGVPRSPRSLTRLSDIDFVRGILFGPAVGGMILAVELGSMNGWTNGVAPTLLLGSLLLAIYWWRNQLRQARPLIDLRLLSHGKALGGLIAMALLGLALQGGQVFSLLLQQSDGTSAGFGLSATRAGMMMALINGTAIFSSPIAGWLAKRFGVRPIAILGAGIMVVGWVFCIFAFGSLGTLVAGAIVTVTGVNMATTPLYLLIVESTPPELTSGAAGLANTLYNLGFAVGSQIVLVILMGGGNGAANANDYLTAFIWLALASGAVLCPMIVGSRLGRIRDTARGVA